MILMKLNEKLIDRVERSEITYMLDRMGAIKQRQGNPEGIELMEYNGAVALTSRTMPWPQFNTIKGIGEHNLDQLDEIIHFFHTQGRKVQLEIIPSKASPTLLKALSEKGLYQSGFHTSLYTFLTPNHLKEPRHNVLPDYIQIREFRESEIELYATIHCRGTGLSDEGIPYIVQNNQVLFARTGWKFFLGLIHDQPAGVGVMYIKDGVGSCTFAATLPEFRQQGIHAALLQERMKESIQSGCDLFVSQAGYLSQSHRNMEQIGLKIAYTRATWTEK